MPATAEPSAAVAEVGTVGRVRLWVGVSAGASFLLSLGYLTLVLDAGLDVSTVVLSMTAAALVLCLGAMYSMVLALGRGAGQGRELASQRHSGRELREEKKRLLRAIKELDFDFELGKLSREDYKQVSDVFRTRAVEIMRVLEGKGPVHPDLQAVLSNLEASPEPAPEPEPEPEPEPAGADHASCVSCSASNDLDAKFCKQCGQELGA